MQRKNILKLALLGLTAGLCLSAKTAAGDQELALSKCTKTAPPDQQPDKTSCKAKTDDEGSCGGNCGGGASCDTPGDCNDVGQLDESHSEKMTEKRISASRSDDK